MHEPVRVLVDGDSCPMAVRELLLRAAGRGRIDLAFISKRVVPGVPSEYAEIVGEKDVDAEILERLEATGSAAARSLVVTRDIPLAERVLAAGACVINDRGTEFDAGSIAVRRSERDAAAAIRSAGLERMPRHRGFGEQEKRAFANAFDRAVRRLSR